MYTFILQESGFFFSLYMFFFIKLFLIIYYYVKIWFVFIFQYYDIISYDLIFFLPHYPQPLPPTLIKESGAAWNAQRRASFRSTWKSGECLLNLCFLYRINGLDWKVILFLCFFVSLFVSFLINFIDLLNTTFHYNDLHILLDLHQYSVWYNIIRNTNFI